jgi:hypothetical protein
MRLASVQRHLDILAESPRLVFVTSSRGSAPAIHTRRRKRLAFCQSQGRGHPATGDFQRFPLASSPLARDCDTQHWDACFRIALSSKEHSRVRIARYCTKSIPGLPQTNGSQLSAGSLHPQESPQGRSHPPRSRPALLDCLIDLVRRHKALHSGPDLLGLPYCLAHSLPSESNPVSLRLSRNTCQFRDDLLI